MKRKSKSMIFYILVIILCVYGAFFYFNAGKSIQQYSYNEFLTDMQSGIVKEVMITRSNEVGDAGTARVIFKDANKHDRILPILHMPQFSEMMKTGIEEYGIKFIGIENPKTSLIENLLFPLIIMIVSIFFLLFIFQQMQGGSGGNRVMNFGKNRAKMITDDKQKVTFDSVAGLNEEKLELQEIVDFLKSPKKYIEIGARIPKGVLLVGPPGTGKTLLAKSVSGEAGVPFFSISGSDFVEMFVGVGASRVRDLFEQAKKNLPCIVFIDEIDAVGRKRGAGLGGGHDEREQTLNQLLVEMDGFGVNEGVIIIAATNRPDILDPALLRPGRFDRQVVVGIPDINGREQILKVHSKGKLISKDVDLRDVAATTPGFTGADLENLLNEAALLSARENKKEIDMEELRKAFVKVGIGTEKRSKVISKKERKITAYHEAGHGIIHEILPDIDSVHIISIIPTGMAGGYTMHMPNEDKMYSTKRRMEQQVISLLAGRAAEEIVLDDITTGASNDIEKATAIARAMVTKYGMSDSLGPILFGDDNQEVFLGRDLAHTRNYGEEVASTIDREIKKIIDNSYSIARKIIEDNIEILHKTAELLMEKEKITGDEFRALFPEGILIKKEDSISKDA